MGVVLKEVWGTPSYNRRNRIYFCPYLMIIQRGGGGGGYTSRSRANNG